MPETNRWGTRIVLGSQPRLRRACWAGVSALVLAAAIVTASGSAWGQEGREGDEDLRIVRQALIGGLRNQVGTLPIPTGGAFTYDFDPTVGVFTRTTETLGPIFADRAETIGRGKFTLTANFTYHSYDELDGVPLQTGGLQSISQVFNDQRTAVRVGLNTVKENVQAEVYTLSGTYGLTDRIDVGLTVPIVRVRVTEVTTRIGFRDCFADFSFCTRFFPQNLQRLPSSEESSGLGDLDLRVKYNFLSQGAMMGGRWGLAASLNVKAPTGDSGDRTTSERARLIRTPRDLVVESRYELGSPPTGTGIFRVKPQLIASGSWFGIEPHINVGAELGETAGVSNDVIYAVGVDVAASAAITVAAGVVGRYSLDVQRRRAAAGRGQADLDAVIANRGVEPPGEKADPHQVTGSVGVKLNLAGTFIVVLNVLFPLNDASLRDNLTPTIGVEWTF